MVQFVGMPAERISKCFEIVILVRDLKLENVRLPMLVTLLRMEILERDLQPKNAFLPMLVTLSGMEMLVRDLQS